jgi:Tfp pilus assembly protein PilF
MKSEPGIQARVDALLARAGQALAAARPADAERAVRAALALSPGHAQALRMLASVLQRQRRHAEAVAVLRRICELAPEDPALLNGLAISLQATGETHAAIEAFRRASALAPRQPTFKANLGKALVEADQLDAAVAALEEAVELAPDLAPPRFTLAYVHRTRGDRARAEAELREIVRRNPSDGHGWLGLADLGVSASDDDVEAMRRALADSRLSGRPRIALGFALAHAHEEHERYEQAWSLYVAMNREEHVRDPWDRAAERARSEALLAAFDLDPAVRAPADLGRGIVFLVGMPRSGSTLAEQILASHSSVAAGGELPVLGHIVDAESVRRGRPLTEWAAHARAEDFERLGRDYLARTAHLRAQRAFSTDKRPGNWRLIPLIRHMLPAARIVVCRRDPVETALACFVRLFIPGTQRYAYDLGDLADYWRNFDRAVGTAMARDPEGLREHGYESLVAAPESEIRALLGFCGLEFEPGCLSFNETERVIRTQSALQVRRPLRIERTRAAYYDPWLAPLRRALDPAPPDR